MKKALILVLCVVLTVIGNTGCRSVSTSSSVAKGRSFEFEYAFKLTEIPEQGKSLRVWVPLPSSDENQRIRDLQIISPVKYRITQEAENGNRMAYLEVQGGTRDLPRELPVVIRFSVRRQEARELITIPTDEDRYLQPDVMAPFNDEVKRRAATATSGKVGAQEEASGIYQSVLASVDYDKSGEGWGHGDLLYVCESGKGNCSDFHTLFTAMSRVSGVPAFFEIGFPLPARENQGEIDGYHCWAWYKDATAWRPVDVSEADKNPSRSDYFFGTICENRVALSKGRDIQLEPRQSGKPINFFIYPYYELDGKVDERIKTEKRFLFKQI